MRGILLPPPRATDKARSILKECSDNLAQAVGSLPPSDLASSLARQSARAPADQEPMDTSGPSAAKKVSPFLC